MYIDANNNFFFIRPVPEPGPRSVAVGNVVEFEDISERRTRSTY